MIRNHQQVSNSRPATPQLSVTTDQHLRDDTFSRLVRQVVGDPHNPFNIERYLWVLEEPLLRACATCGGVFDPWFGYDGDPAHGQTRQYCSRTCRDRASWVRRCRRASHAVRQGGLAA